MTSNQKVIFPAILQTSLIDYCAFVGKLPNYKRMIPDISQIRLDTDFTSATLVAAEIFGSQIQKIKDALNDDHLAITAIDIVECDALSSTENTFWGVLAALSIGANIFRMSLDRANNTPYTLYAASYKRSKELEDRGIAPVAPESKLGFHTDGVIRGSAITIPTNILLYNVTINYRKPGMFHWVPFSLWTEKSKYMKSVGVGTKFKLKVTPSVYDVNGSLETPFPTVVNVPIFFNSEVAGYPLYLNGNILGKADDSDFDLSIIDKLKKSLSQNKVVLSIPQKTRRLILACNLKGAHARDVFEDAIPEVKYTRLFLRSVDNEGFNLN